MIPATLAVGVGCAIGAGSAGPAQASPRHTPLATAAAPAPAPAGQRNPAARNLAPAPRTDHPGAMRLDSGGSAGAGKLTGTHYIAYLPLTWTATKPPQDPRANAQTYGYDYFLEYRAATGLEAWTDDRTYTDPQGVVRSTPGGGVILTRAKVGTPTSVFPAELMNLYPPAPGAPDTQRHPGLSAGEVLHAPDGLFSLHVSAADNDRASVALSFPGLRKVARWSGQDRYDASARISGASFAPGVNTAYLASGEVYTDALSGATVAGMTRGPVLLTKRESLPSAISTELRRLRPGRIVVLGGPNTITYAVQATLGRYLAP